MDYFHNRVAIVTGGASGIGRAICEELGRRGASVVVADIDLEGANRVASGISAEGGRASAVYLDVTDAEEVQTLILATASEHGRLDFMFNNAGICMVGEVRDMHLHQWQKMMDVNLWGVIYGTTAAYQVMLKQGHGHIVNIASADGLMPFPMMTAYSTGKHAVIGLSTSLRAEAAALGVKISVACPGVIETDMQGATLLLTQVSDEEAIYDLGPSWIATSADSCTNTILNGVERNKGIIMVTAFAQVCWWLYRLHPALIKPLNRFWIDKIRTIRVDGQS